jgi:hypothetical protein
MKWNKGDKVVVKGLDMAFVVESYLDVDLVKLFIEGEGFGTSHYIIHARPDVLLPNNTETAISEGWIKK